MNQYLVKATQAIKKAERIVAFTGAGISAESGIPTFRGQGGLWDNYPPIIFGNIPGLAMAFLFHHRKVIDFATDVIEVIMNAEPNPAHKILAEMESQEKLSAVVTQNIDNLHQKSGSKSVIELHGNVYRLRCMRCKAKREVDEERLRVVIKNLKKERPSKIGLVRRLREIMPRCEDCHGRLRPDIVLFGESLPRDQIMRATYELSNCDLLILIGTSGVVYPVASLPSLARRKGSIIIEIAGERTSLSHLANYILPGQAGEILPILWEKANKIV